MSRQIMSVGGGDSVRGAASRREGRILVVAAGMVLVLAACGSTPPTPTPTPTLSTQQSDRDRLAGLAAAAKDRRYVATYTYSAANRTDRTVTVAVANDGTWVVGIPGGALSGYADIAMFGGPSGVFQCALSRSPGADAARPDLAVTPGCVAVATLAPATDPGLQHLFTDWIDPLVDRATALSVATTALLPGAAGACFSVESNSAALDPPVDPGVYCYTPDGMLTGARVTAGTVVLTGPVSPGPRAVDMPGRVVTQALLPLTAPPPPPPPPPPPSPKP
jgi:hypothetical protein